MKKIPSLFVRDFETGGLTREPDPVCQWVFNGEGVATRKFDGSAVLVAPGGYFKRRMVRPDKDPPPGFQEVDKDPNTGKRFGWVLVDKTSKNDQYHMEAFEWELTHGGRPRTGTYELIGPKVNSNREEANRHLLISHAEAARFQNVPRDYDGLKEWFKGKDVEGIVFHHPDGRMVKIKKGDFGMDRKD